MNKTAFITGGTGFLGINLIHQLKNQAWDVYALHRKNSDVKYLSQTGAKMIEGSLLDYDSLRINIPHRVDAIFHIAGNTSMWRKRNKEQYQDNVVGTQNLVNAALEVQAKKFICTSSVNSFGIHNTKIDETFPSLANANDPINYNRTKYLAELEVDKGIENGLDAVILNPCHIIGPYDQHSWAQLIKQTYHKKLPGIPPGVGMFCHVKDVAQAHIAAVEMGRTGERYLLGGTEARFIDFLNILQKILGRKPFSKESPSVILKAGLLLSNIKSVVASSEPDFTKEKYILVTSKIICNYNKAVAELGYQTTPMEVMIKDCFDWLKKEGLL